MPESESARALGERPRRGPLTRLAVAALLAAAAASAEPLSDRARAAAEFLADKPAELVVIARAEQVETRWTVIEHGDHVPVLRVRSTVVRTVFGSGPAPGEGFAAMQFDYSEMIFEAISPPPVIGQEYLLLVNSPPAGAPEWLAGLAVDWVVHPQGAHRLRGAENERFIYWQGRRHALADLEALLVGGEPISLELIGDPETRLRVAGQRLEGSLLGDPEEYVRGVVALVRRSADPAAGEREEPPFGQWYEALALLRRLGRQEAHRAAVVAGLRPLLADGGEHRRIVVAVLLAELGDAGGREILEATLAAADVALNSDPAGGLSLPGRLPYDDSSVAAAANALGRLGGRQGLGHPEIDVRLAAADGLGGRGGEELLAELRSTARELDPEVRRMEQSGELAAEREPGDYRQRYPHQWVKAHQLLARLGDDASLQQLVTANQTDWRTYPERQTPVHPRQEVATWSSAPHRWPSLAQALISADRDPARLLARLESLYGDASTWQDAVLLSVRSRVLGEPPPDDRPSPRADEAETLRRIERLLASEDPRRRAEGLAGAGFRQVEKHFEEVRRTALEGSGIERQAAIYGLGFYDRELAAEELARLCREGTLGSRVGGLELATRRRPQPFAGEAMALLSEIAEARGSGGDGSMSEFELETVLRQLPRILARFARGPIPAPILAGLGSPSPAVRLATVEALALGGNPAAGPPLRAAAGGADGELGQAIQAALEQLGPEQ